MTKRYFLLTICLCFCMALFAKGIKINFKTNIKPYHIKIEKVEFKNNKALLYGKIKQQNRFSYSVSFENCSLSSSSLRNPVKGELVEWNDNKKITNLTRTVSDQSDESFIIAFPEDEFPQSGTIDLTLGTILDRAKTPLLLQDIPLKKK